VAAIVGDGGDECGREEVLRRDARGGSAESALDSSSSVFMQQSEDHSRYRIGMIPEPGGWRVYRRYPTRQERHKRSWVEGRIVGSGFYTRR